MADFLFQLKGKAGDSSYSNWSWPPIWTDKVEASDKKEAHSIIEANFGKRFPLRVLQKDLDSNEFLLIIKEIKADDHHTISLFENKSCKQCGRNFKMIEKYQQGNSVGGGATFCSYSCNDEYSKVERFRANGANMLAGTHAPVIYKISNKVTGKCYIGKTTQAFTLRWYQHFFQGGSTQFHAEIKATKVTDWTFEVIEIIELPADMKQIAEVHKFILEREMYHITECDSIRNGYNTTASLNAQGKINDGVLTLFES